MKVKLLGIQRINFTVEETSEHIEGYKLHVVSVTPENDKAFRGLRCAAVFTKMEDAAKLLPDTFIDLVYEQTLGSNRSRLVAINPIR